MLHLSNIVVTTTTNSTVVITITTIHIIVDTATTIIIVDTATTVIVDTASTIIHIIVGIVTEAHIIIVGMEMEFTSAPIDMVAEHYTSKMGEVIFILG